MGRFEKVRTDIRRAFQARRASPRDTGTEPTPEAEKAEPPADPIRAVSPVDPIRAVSPPSHDDLDVPYGIRLAASWAWRGLAIGAAAAAVLWVVARLQEVLIPLAIALLLSALLSPVVAWLRARAKMHRSLATTVVVIGGLAAVVGTLTLVISQFVRGFPKLTRSAVKGIGKVQGWLKTGPLHLTQKQLNDLGDAAQRWLDDHRASLTVSALSTATAIFGVLAGMFLVIFATFFFLRDGGRIWRFLVSLLPAGAREPVASAGEAAWLTLVAYVRATVIVAIIDASGIGLGLVILRVQLALPLAALVFLGAFIPIVGATLSGAVAVLVALVTRGPITALVVLAIVIGVQQLEGHVLQPLIMGRAVAIHPLAVIVAIASGVVLAGIVGALVAVPVVAVINTAVRHLAARRSGELPPDDNMPIVVRSD